MKKLLLVLLFVPALAAQTVFVDATDARHGIFHTHVTLPAKSGPMTFVYPKWIPGEHMPTGPLMQVAGLHVHAGAAEIPWSRDRVDMFAFHVDVPANASSIDVDFDYMSPSSTFGGGYGESANATQNLLLILFNNIIVYPANTPSDAISFRASVRLPAGWKFDTALPIASQSGDRLEFAPVSLTTLVDSPIVAGVYQRQIPITDTNRIIVTADSASALAMNDARIAQIRNLVAETDALFGARHYRTYRWLVTLSDLVEPQGLEHHECTDIRQVERGLTDPDQTARTITILSHEFVHSWNGKYRRPAGLATPDYQQPMIGDLLWVYEGMTRYLGDFVLSARTGMRTLDEDREFAAWVIANQDHNRPGRNWRPLVDTAVDVQTIGLAPAEEVPYRRALDYYDEALPLWLDADTTIRAKSGGTKSLDDFAKIFFGVEQTLLSAATQTGVSVPHVKPYTLDDVVGALNRVVPNDWRAFLDQRVYRVAPHPPSIEASGWRVVYNETPNWYASLRERTSKQTDESFTIGIWVKQDGTIADVIHPSPLMAGMKITAVNGRKYSSDVLHEEIAAKHPLELSVEQGTWAGTIHLDYRDGERYPHLERIAGAPDALSDILRPHATPR
ncbi:MAG TPA: M61 family peptidase [Thermoanaerobaculia bacterium]|nr:M61 family peptidase [Thermoanaerobaculia bacterium]